jgi:VanZ family protein
VRWLAVVLYIGVIFSLSSIQRPPPGPALAHFDKLLHMAEYGILGLLLGWALLGGLPARRGAATDPAAPRRLGRVVVPALLVAVVIAIADELYQLRVPRRESSVTDALADLAGVALALIAIGLVGRWQAGRAARGKSHGETG